jgi:hypothetical protein
MCVTCVTCDVCDVWRDMYSCHAAPFFFAKGTPDCERRPCASNLEEEHTRSPLWEQTSNDDSFDGEDGRTDVMQGCCRANFPSFFFP